MDLLVIRTKKTLWKLYHKKKQMSENQRLRKIKLFFSRFILIYGYIVDDTVIKIQL